MSSTTAPAQVVYQSTVTAVGSQVEPFLSHGLVIFFGEDSPKELHDMSVRHRPTVADQGPLPGDTMWLGEQALEILAVGDVVGDNLLKLGHLDLKADGRTVAKLPGDVCVAEQPLPLLKPGDAFRIVRGSGVTEVAP